MGMRALAVVNFWPPMPHLSSRSWSTASLCSQSEDEVASAVKTDSPFASPNLHDQFPVRAASHEYRRCLFLNSVARTLRRLKSNGSNAKYG